jgi:hypothetical protein
VRAPSEHILERDHELAGKLVHGDAEEHVRAGRRQVDLDPVQGGVLGDRVGVGQRGDEAVQLGRRETWVPDSQRRAEADDDRDLILRYLAAPHHLGAGDMRIAAVAMGDASQARVGVRSTRSRRPSSEVCLITLDPTTNNV